MKFCLFFFPLNLITFLKTVKITFIDISVRNKYPHLRHATIGAKPVHTVNIWKNDSQK